ncbi:MAG: PorP/SprF family type IX secretion system membrane protein [Flavobacteriales bacterium]|nr:PorP/SprF family type IX secretion system membrane protein [Flavobacteriales bacterium]
MKTLMKKQHLFILVFTLITTSVFAQNIGKHSQLVFTKGIVNPAAYEADRGSQIWLKHHEQWTTIDNAPSSSILGATVALQDETMTLGGNMFIYQVGVFRNTGMTVNYSYKVEISEDMDLRLGIAPMIYTFGYRLDAANPEGYEPLLDNSTGQSAGFDANFGTYLTGENFYIGASLINMLEKVDFNNGASPILNTIKRQYYIMTGYTHEVNDNISLNPNIIVSQQFGSDVLMSGNLLLNYNNQFDFGLAYSSDKTLSVISRYTIKELVNIGYSYDFDASVLQDYNNGSHEIMVGVQF